MGFAHYHYQARPSRIRSRHWHKTVGTADAFRLLPLHFGRLMEYHQEIEILDNAYSAKISAIPFPHPNSVVSSFLFPVSFPSFLFIYPSWLCTWVYTHTNPIFLYSRPAVGFELLLHHLNTPQGTTTRHRPWKQHRCHTRRVGQSAGIAIEPSTRFSNIFILSSNLLHPSSASQLAAYPAQTTQLLVMAHRGASLSPAHHLLPGLLSPEHLFDFLIDPHSSSAQRRQVLSLGYSHFWTPQGAARGG